MDAIQIQNIYNRHEKISVEGQACSDEKKEIIVTEIRGISCSEQECFEFHFLSLFSFLCVQQAKG